MAHNIEDFVQLCLKQAGKRYVWGGAGPDVFDCSGMVMWCAKQLGVSLPHYSGSQYDAVQHISIDQATKTRGALLFEGAHASQHVVVSLGNGKTIEARSAHMTPNIGSWDIAGRPWTCAGLIPGFVYGAHPTPAPSTPRWPGVYFRLKTPHFQGDSVKWIQTRLVNHGFSVGHYGIDADFGNDTDHAVRAFQTAQKIESDGIVGSVTWGHLAAK